MKKLVRYHHNNSSLTELGIYDSTQQSVRMKSIPSFSLQTPAQIRAKQGPELDRLDRSLTPIKV